MTTVPQIRPDDTPRARLSDPVQSHMAADRSQRTIKGASKAVLVLVYLQDCLSGSQINAEYAHSREHFRFPQVAADTPRKRASDLCNDGFLEATGTQKAIRLQERIFTITEQGKREIGVR
ncbi:hypothetical protein [Cryobacterium soli]|uniref:hypothetical protein n=1 Tax=Cryobacterium soli TaxID=2220095 RepID=UPI000E752E4F|nr:hypothetical protein [Cryobacterium soli]